ncbi:hypothetical protein [Bradyrhizobium liaoningense]|uniref:hypothetical protein n=1 Tax=Bradyrhizobium liaoningense TaxID=43992 RepID=UPI001BA82333|nr:hypothetical protein [Bradyrhizobium liaoningense]MBR0997739.1 hypothetical protein [Bradyrhizobium liaoningense]
MPRNITNRDCIKAVTKRQKIYDADCKGFYVSLSPTAPPTFSLKYTCPIRKRRATHRLGVYQQAGDGIEAREVAYWRIAAMKLVLRIANGEDIAATAQLAQQAAAKGLMTVDELIDLRIAWMRRLVPKGREKDGVTLKMRPFKKAWAEMAGHLNRLVRPRLGSKIVTEVTKGDIAQLQTDILAGMFNVRKRKPEAGPPISRARHMRKAVSGLFKWAAQKDYVSASPCITILEKRPSSKPGRGLVKHLIEIINDRKRVVLSIESTVLIATSQ